MAAVDHYNIRRVVDIYANVQGRDLGAVGRDIRTIVDADASICCRAAASSRSAARSRRCTAPISDLLAGLAFSILLVYLLIVVNFQSWLDPFIIITRPAGGAGRHRAVPVLHRHDAERAGADGRHHVHGRRDRQQHPGGRLSRASGWRSTATRSRAAIEAGFTRFRPVLMTALAMIIGMVPMALGLGEGGEQNAPLGRAVIGGLLLATVATLVFVPAVFALFHARRSAGAAAAAEATSTAGSLGGHHARKATFASNGG